MDQRQGLSVGACGLVGVLQTGQGVIPEQEGRGQGEGAPEVAEEPDDLFDGDQLPGG